MRYARGFTLVELLITLAILAIVTAAAAPSFRNMIKNNELVTVRDQIQSSLLFAKSEAVSRNRRVSVCPSADGVACAGANDWSDGWIVYEDLGTEAATNVDTILRRIDVPEAVDVTFAAAAGGGFRPFVQYRATGLANVLSDAVFHVCDTDRSVEGRAVLLSVTTGQVRLGAQNEAICP